MSRIAAIQMASGPQIQANLMEAGRLIKQASIKGANLLVLPENFAIMGNTEQDKVFSAEVYGSGKIQDFIREQAQKHKVWIVAGTIPLQSEQSGKVYASSILYNANGEQVARYDKMHLFDVRLKASGSANEETYNESATTVFGDKHVVVETPFGRIGMAICYDLRFPHFFQRLVDLGAEIFVLPAAFTEQTGKAHWEVLLRSRAIENLSYMVAAAQGGYHVNGRITYGNSMIVDPWGQINDRLEKTPGIVNAEIDLDCLYGTRKYFPVLEHRRDRINQ